MRAGESGKGAEVGGAGGGESVSAGEGGEVDGVYDVVGCEVLDGGTAMGRVLLVRSGGAGADSVGWG